MLFDTARFVDDSLEYPANQLSVEILRCKPNEPVDNLALPGRIVDWNITLALVIGDLQD